MPKPTIKMYDIYSYVKEFAAEVVSCEKKDGFYSVVLDRTAFFAEGGGQSADTGKIDDANVLDVQISDDVVYHKTDKPLKVGTTVICEIDWDIRFLRMQNHSAEHLISGIIHNLYGYNNVGFHMNDRFITLDCDGALTETDIAKIELEANKAIYANKKINILFPLADELSKYDYRSKLDITENVRLVEIEDYDLCACCAPHVASTGEIGIIKILNFMPYKKGTRIEMVAGLLAFNDYCNLHNSNKAIMNLLSAKREEIFTATEKIHKDLGDVRAENKKLSAELALLQMEQYRIPNGVCVFVNNASYDELRNCTNTLVEEFDYCYAFSTANEDDYIYVVASKEHNIRETVQNFNKAFNGKGGGRDFYAQGKIIAKSKEEILAFFGDYFDRQAKTV